MLKPVFRHMQTAHAPARRRACAHACEPSRQNMRSSPKVYWYVTDFKREFRMTESDSTCAQTGLGMRRCTIPREEGFLVQRLDYCIYWLYLFLANKYGLTEQ